MGRRSPPPLTLINYPFSRDAALNRAHSAPGILRDIAGPLLGKHYARWLDLPRLPAAPARRYRGMNNFAAVREAVTVLGVAVARARLEGQKTLVLGGGHTQGIATIKACALVYIVERLLAGKIPCTGDLAPLRGAVSRRNIPALCRAFERLVETRRIARRDIEKAAAKIRIIWLDSHPDYNDRRTSASGNIHGMALAACTGRDLGGIENLFCGQYIRINPKNIFVLCARDIDPGERRLMERDGVNYRRWELTKPGAMRTVADPENPVTLAAALEKILRKTGKNPLVFSMDIDAVHAGLHHGPFGPEGVTATGTPMGLNPRDVSRVFSGAASGTGLVRLNAAGRSPAGPSAPDVFAAVWEMMLRENLLGADLSEISPAAGTQGHPVAEAIRGLTLRTSMKILAAMLGADLGRFSKAIEKQSGAIGERVRMAMRQEKRAARTARKKRRTG